MNTEEIFFRCFTTLLSTSKDIIILTEDIGITARIHPLVSDTNLSGELEKYRNLDHVFKCGKSFLAEIKKRLEAKTKSGISISPHFYNNLLFEKKKNKNKNRCLERHEVPNLY